MDREEGVSISLHLDPTPAIISIFPHPFRLTYVITLTAHQLSTDLHVVNPVPAMAATSLSHAAAAVSATFSSANANLPASIAPSTETAETVKSVDGDLRFQALLHTYFRVEDASAVKIKGLMEGLTYIDKVKGGTKETWGGGDLTIREETDRVYQDIGNEDLIIDTGGGKGFKSHRVDFPDCVTWNGSTNAGKMSDMEPTGWERYVCVEPGYVKNFKVLKPGEEWIGQQVLTIL